MNKGQSLYGGQSLYELVVAIAISALIAMAVVSVATSSIQNSTYSKNQSLASSYAQEGTEWLRGQRDANIDNFLSKAPTSGNTNYYCLDTTDTTTWNNTGHCGSSEVIANTSFLRELKFTTTTTVSGKTQIEADVTVSWTDAKGTHTVTNATNFSDWRQR